MYSYIHDFDEENNRFKDVHDIKYLSDISKRDVKFDTYKKYTNLVAENYRNPGVFGKEYERFSGYSRRMLKCANNLTFYQTFQGDYKLMSAYFCKIKYCPICQWRKTLLWRARIARGEPKLIEYLKSCGDNLPEFLFLTLTLKNVKGLNYDKVKSCIDLQLEGFSKLMAIGRYHRSKPYFDHLGWIRCLEITKGMGHNNYHPHIHALVMVKPGFYPKGRNNYSNKLTYQRLSRQLSHAWRKCCHINYNPQVKLERPRFDELLDSESLHDKSDDSIIQPFNQSDLDAVSRGEKDLYDILQYESEEVDNSKSFDSFPYGFVGDNKKPSKKNKLWNSFAEITKYSVKGNCVLKSGARWLLPLTLATFNTHMIQTGGLFREFFKSAEDRENLIFFDDEENDYFVNNNNGEKVKRPRVKFSYSEKDKKYLLTC